MKSKILLSGGESGDFIEKMKAPHAKDQSVGSQKECRSVFSWNGLSGKGMLKSHVHGEKIFGGYWLSL